MNGIKICVAIPTYNHSERLQEIIDTLPPKMSAIVVDDGSFPPISLKPGSADILRFEKNAGKAEAPKAADLPTPSQSTPTGSIRLPWFPILPRQPKSFPNA